MPEPILRVRDLRVHFKRKNYNPFADPEVVHAVDGITLDIRKGTTLGLIGESGSGKTTLARAVMRLTPITAGSVTLDGEAVEDLRGENARLFRRNIQYIFQDPYSSLNPRERAGDIVRSPLDVLNIGTTKDRKERVSELFSAIGLRPEQEALFPHQFSGGQRQRLNIARALAPDPKIIVCDEPVSALDVAIRAQILNLLQKIKREREITYLFISHDMSVIKHMADEVAVMYLGQIVERAPRKKFFTQPLHPYSSALMSAVPKIRTGAAPPKDRLMLSGDPPSPVHLPKGCRFAPRCPVAVDECHSREPALRELAPDHHVSCHRVDSSAGTPVPPIT